MSILDTTKTLLVLFSIPILAAITALIVLVHVVIILILLLTEEIIGLFRR
jgi:hypothetical protein|tara:strand:+ start:410 stop:559 length:150 start_codon:yes stop_codon:yes gene_type:complete